MTNRLHDLTALITRPAHQADPLCQAIENLGGHCIRFPTVAIVFDQDDPCVTAAMQQIDSVQTLVFVSANAVHALLTRWPHAGDHRSIIAIGPGTANALKHYGINHLKMPAHYDSEGLLAMPQLTDVAQQHILIACGQQPRPLLAQTLRERGAHITLCCCYHRELPHVNVNEALPSTVRQQINCIICTSAENLTQLHQLLQDDLTWLQSQPLLVINQKMADLAKQLGFTQSILIAENASDQAIVNTLLKAQL